jgi:Skp family chaperone for outer membrane proteins
MICRLLSEVAVRTIGRLILGAMMILTAASAAAGEIGFLDAERAVLSVQEGRSQLRALEEWATPRRTQLEGLQGQVAELNQRLAAQRSVASPEALAQLDRELVQAQRDLEDQVRAFNRDLPARRDRMLGELSAKIMTVAAEYAEANGVDAIFLLGAHAVAYHAKKLDVTDAIIRLYDERYPVSE